mmetsp:Transcript_47319/g.133473  ORF Transcript_47319/g.133473 Transcript_47319/m.133473 type:complete len:242 (+) Transcript_47319:303-1028(+)
MLFQLLVHLLFLGLLEARDDVREPGLRRVVEVVLLREVDQLLVGLLLPDEGALLHLSHLHDEQPCGLSRVLELLPKLQHVSLEGVLPVLHDLVEALEVAVLDVKMIAELLHVGVDHRVGVILLRRRGRSRPGPLEESVVHHRHGQHRVRRHQQGVGHERLHALQVLHPAPGGGPLHAWHVGHPSPGTRRLVKAIREPSRRRHHGGGQGRRRRGLLAAAASIPGIAAAAPRDCLAFPPHSFA